MVAKGVPVLGGSPVHSGYAEDLLVGFDPGSTACKFYDGENTLLIDSVLAEEGEQLRSLDVGEDLAFQQQFFRPQLPSNKEGVTLRVRRSESGATYLLGTGATEGQNPRSLAYGQKDDLDVQLFLDAGLAALRPEATQINAKIVTHCPISEYLKGQMPASISRLLSGTRTRWINNRCVTISVQVLEVGPEAIPVLYFLAARRELKAGPLSLFKVLDFGGRTLDMAYLSKGMLNPQYSRHFERGHDAFKIEAVTKYLTRLRIFNIEVQRISTAIADGTFKYFTEDQRVIDFSNYLGEVDEEYARTKIKDITSLWRNVPADQVIIHGGAVTPNIMSHLNGLYPSAHVVPENLARLANCMGLYYRAKKLIERSNVNGTTHG
jgi:hypothetical protein